jgi:hypothetical protein
VSRETEAHPKSKSDGHAALISSFQTCTYKQFTLFFFVLWRQRASRAERETIEKEIKDNAETRVDLETRDFRILFQNGVGLTVTTIEPTPLL